MTLLAEKKTILEYEDIHSLPDGFYEAFKIFDSIEIRMSELLA